MMQAAHGTVGRQVARPMLDGPVFVEGKERGVLLTVVQVNGHAIGGDFLKRTFVQNTLSHIRHGIGRIVVEIDHVTPAEVGQHLLGRKAQYQGVIAAIVRRLSTIGHRQVKEDIPCLYLLMQRHIPEVGHAPTLSLLLTYLREQLFAIDERHHPCEISMFQG